MGKLSLLIFIFLAGCSYIPQSKVWVSVEKPPMRVILIDDENDLTAERLNNIMNYVSAQPYKDYNFNSSTSVNVGYNAEAKHFTETKFEATGGKNGN